MKPCCSPSRRSGSTSKPHQPMAVSRAMSKPSHETVDIPPGSALKGTDRPLFETDGEGPLRKRQLDTGVTIEVITVAKRPLQLCDLEARSCLLIGNQLLLQHSAVRLIGIGVI